jgi:hypothetical protein
MKEENLKNNLSNSRSRDQETRLPLFEIDRQCNRSGAAFLFGQEFTSESNDAGHNEQFGFR